MDTIVCKVHDAVAHALRAIICMHLYSDDVRTKRPFASILYSELGIPMISRNMRHRRSHSCAYTRSSTVSGADSFCARLWYWLTGSGFVRLCFLIARHDVGDRVRIDD